VAPLTAAVEVQVRRMDWGLAIHSELGVSRLGVDGRCVENDPNRYVAAVARELMRRGIPVASARVVVRSDLPMGRGFSSSAALSVAAASALAEYAGVTLSADTKAEVALSAERDDLGIGCGPMDPLACAHGAVLHIRWPHGEKTVLDGQPNLLAAAFSGAIPSRTILDALAANQERADVAAALDGWGRLADQGALVLDDAVALGALMNEAQDLYDAIDLDELAAPRLAEARAAIEDLCTGSKFTGAGGDRSLVAVFEDPAAQAEAGRRLHDLGLITVS
jgi:mevalonate kinase